MLNDKRVVDAFEAHGLLCVIARGGPTGQNFCGYVQAPDGFVCNDGREFAVHGGVTWSDWRLPWQESDGERWWLGFDTCHGGDAVPGMPSIGGVYRDIAYVQGECESLASQIAARATK